jgi:hypothetical protein
VERLSKKSLSSVSSTDIKLVHRSEMSPVCPLTQASKAFVLGLFELFRQSLEGEFCELRLYGVLGSLTLWCGSFDHFVLVPYAKG